MILLRFGVSNEITTYVIYINYNRESNLCELKYVNHAMIYNKNYYEFLCDCSLLSAKVIEQEYQNYSRIICNRVNMIHNSVLQSDGKKRSKINTRLKRKMKISSTVYMLIIMLETLFIAVF